VNAGWCDTPCTKAVAMPSRSADRRIRRCVLSTLPSCIDSNVVTASRAGGVASLDKTEICDRIELSWQDSER
jgi:hypothetical protein